MRRKMVAQALDYAASISELRYSELQEKVAQYFESKSQKDPLRVFEELGTSEEEPGEGREVFIYLVGTGPAKGLERIVDYLAEKFELPITVSSFQVYSTENGQQILVRELLETETKSDRSYSTGSVDEIIGAASQYGLAEEFRTLADIGTQFGLYSRPYKRSVMLTPQSNKTRTILNIKVPKRDKNALKLYVATSAIAELFPLSEKEVVTYLGEEGSYYKEKEEFQHFSERFQELFLKIERIQQEEIE